MPGDYRDYSDADKEWRMKNYELETALEEKRPGSEIEKLKEEVKELKGNADRAWSSCVDIW